MVEVAAIFIYLKDTSKVELDTSIEILSKKLHNKEYKYLSFTFPI